MHSLQVRSEAQQVRTILDGLGDAVREGGAAGLAATGAEQGRGLVLGDDHLGHRHLEHLATDRRLGRERRVHEDCLAVGATVRPVYHDPVGFHRSDEREGENLAAKDNVQGAGRAVLERAQREILRARLVREKDAGIVLQLRGDVGANQRLECTRKDAGGRFARAQPDGVDRTRIERVALDFGSGDTRHQEGLHHDHCDTS